MLGFAAPLAVTVALIMLATVTPTGAQTNPPPQSAQKAKHFALKKKQSVALNYLLFLPRDYKATSKKKWPVILFLHGSGERGNDIWKVAVHGPPKLVASQPDFPFIVVSPQCPEDELWSDDAILALLENVIRKYAVDPRRVYLTGLSMGGYGTWSLGLSHPDRFAAIVPICGGGELVKIIVLNKRNSEALKSLGIWAFHGDKDSTVPVEESKRLVAELQRIGVREAKLTVYPGVDHDSWSQTYQNPELYDWLLKHQRP